MVKTPRLILVMGCPCSGKTAYALSPRFADFEYVSPAQVDHDAGSLERRLVELIGKQKDIIVDDDNLSQKERAKYLTIFELYANSHKNSPRYVFECHHLTTNLSQIVANAKKRQAHGGARLSKVRLFHARRSLEPPMQTEGFEVMVTVPFQERHELQLVRRAVFFSLPAVVYSANYHLMPRSPEDVRLYPDVNQSFLRYQREGYLFIGVCNLPMIPAKLISHDVAQECIVETIKQLGPPVDMVYYSPHFADERHETSLPNPCFAFRARERFRLNLEASIMVGCTSVDRQFAQNAGIGTFVNRDTFFSDPLS